MKSRGFSWLSNESRGSGDRGDSRIFCYVVGCICKRRKRLKKMPNVVSLRVRARFGLI